MSKESWMINSKFTDQQHDSLGSWGLTNWSLTINKCYCLCSLHSTTAIEWRHIYTCRQRKITLAALFSSTIFDRESNRSIELLKSAKLQNTKKYDSHISRSSILYILQHCKLIFMMAKKNWSELSDLNNIICYLQM